MSQVTIYLDSETEARLERAVRESGLSRSRWIANLIREQVDTAWPESFRHLLGGGEEFPGLDEIRSGMGEDLPRGSL
ncbi:ribbon-helix-helix protein, CopG family [Haloechinothrix sp. YIM 98757]|uniref:Ribbon-helix-helix protein, CopG family n=1 Tax=Haloechinothrix aidingensis TaxID=2752311 RepID=A0A838AGU3_9PSEU|nr:CopG family transcriptional regulator [Haloechinothrix aidingensis]MBA0128307.1 ribbon-helix-helix protein, CopG family [Haloechinothrix aidingensis]